MPPHIERREYLPFDAWFLEDPLFQACMRMCIKEKGGHQSYGSLLVDKNGQLISVARNIQVKVGEPWLRMGYATHAEGMAISLGLLFGKKVKGCSIYVGGILKNGSPLIHEGKKTRFTCTRCAELLLSHDIAGVHLPIENGWKFLTSQEAMDSAREFKLESANNSTGREEESVIKQDLRSLLRESILSKPPRHTIGKIRGLGIRVANEANAILSLTEHGYISAGEFKELVYALIG